VNLPKITFFLLLLLFGFQTRSQTLLADSLLQVAANHPHDTLGIKALVQLSTEVGRHDLAKVKTYSLQALGIANSLKTTVGVSAIYAHLTNYYSNSGMPDSAHYYLKQMKTLAEENPANVDVCSNYF
jgi:hypothetical protein